MTPLDAKLHNPIEGGPSFSLRHRTLRFVWAIVWNGVGIWTPVPFHSWRRLLLRMFGAKIRSTAKVYPWVKVWYPPNLEMADFACLGPSVNCYCMTKITLGVGALVSQGAHLCAGTHDIDDLHFQLITKPIHIGTRAWVAAEAFVGPGVTLGDFAVLGARSVLFRNLASSQVAAGNPARVLRSRRSGQTVIISEERKT